MRHVPGYRFYLNRFVFLEVFLLFYWIECRCCCPTTLPARSQNLAVKNQFHMNNERRFVFKMLKLSCFKLCFYLLKSTKRNNWTHFTYTCRRKEIQRRARTHTHTHGVREKLPERQLTQWTEWILKINLKYSSLGLAWLPHPHPFTQLTLNSPQLPLPPSSFLLLILPLHCSTADNVGTFSYWNKIHAVILSLFTTLWCELR